MQGFSRRTTMQNLLFICYYDFYYYLFIIVIIVGVIIITIIIITIITVVITIFNIVIVVIIIVNVTNIVITIIIIIIIINIFLIKCQLREKILLFIFNPCISLQLMQVSNCPFANFYFILILFIYLFSLLAISLKLFLSCHLNLFLLVLWFCVPLKMMEGFWFSDVSSGCEMSDVNDDLIWLVVFPVYALWVCRRACGSRVFQGDMELERWPEMGRAKKTDIHQQ